MLNDIISAKKNQWLHSPDCAITGLISYIKSVGKLRTPQIEAIETYLFLKIAGENKPLWQNFSEGFFNQAIELNKLNINQQARDYLAKHSNALALYQFSTQQKLKKLTDLILENPSALEYDTIIKSLFYNVSYPDYLLSLPMGAGKTYLMAAFMYLDLYFAELEPDNKHFAHNFLVLIPSGLKSSIVPSLKTIKQFEPSWVLPEPAASHLKSLLKFDVLDESKSAKKSNKANNPNAQKVNNVLPNPFGQVFVVNAEKVILDRIELNPTQTIIEKTDDEKSRFANELRHLIGEIPNLSILIDEVHHAATDDIKLRRVVTDWHAGRNITTVLGFSGTLDSLDQHDNIKIIDSTGNDIAHYSQWLFQIARASFSNLTVQKLRAFNDSLTAIFQRITDQKDQHRTFNTLYDLVKIESQIRLSFAVKRNYETHYDHVKESAQLLKITTVPDVFNDDKLYPSEDNTAQILQSDQNNAALDESQIKRDYEKLSSLGLANTPTFENYKNSLGMTEVSFDVKHKNHSFHYLPYHFDSGFERDVFKDALGLDSVHAKNLEIYYNGERGLTSFVINCATQQGKNLENLGKYTPDFLIIQRDVEQQIHKMLIIETKGNHLGHKFKDRRTFMENDFLEENEKQFGYARFDFLYLEDSNSRYLVDLNTRINQFFNE